MIVLSHVLEHLRNPVQTLGALRSCLAPGGVIYVEVPHVPSEALQRYFDSPWAPRHDEPHLTFFGAPELRALLGRSALSPVFLDTAGPLYREVSALRFRMPPLMPTLRRLLPASVRKLAATKAGAGLQERDPSFFSYGGNRIWLRSISRPT